MAERDKDALLEIHGVRATKVQAAPERHGQAVTVSDFYELIVLTLSSGHNSAGLTSAEARFLAGLLTKRPQNIKKLLPGAWVEQEIGRDAPWPWPNVWLGTTTEDQPRADGRIGELVAIPAAVHFLSCEPLLSEVLLGHWLLSQDEGFAVYRPRIDWLICGGESGPKARPSNPQWFRSLRDQCAAAGVPFFFKQWGDWVSVSEKEGAGEHYSFPDGRTVRRIGKKAAGALLDGHEHKEFPQ